MYAYHDEEILHALKKLAQKFHLLHWDFTDASAYSKQEPVQHWLGDESEEVMINVFTGTKIQEPFHRHDFFFIHFAYSGDYQALSAHPDNRITIKEGDCYVGQPYSGYAVTRDSDQACTIIGVLIQKETFIREFLPSLSADTAMLHFFLAPQKNAYSDVCIHFPIPTTSPIWRLLGLLVLEYANKTEDTQQILKPMIMSLAMYISSEYKRQNLPTNSSLVDQITAYIESHSDSVTLKSTAAHFGYHPVYISRLLPEKADKTFSQLLFESRMRKAHLLLNHTDLSIEKVAAMLGYSNSSNFYKAFKHYYGTSPRRLKE